MKKIKYRKMSAEELKLSRKGLGLTISTMADILMVSPKEYKRYERDGLRAPHDKEGPSIRVVQVLTLLPTKGIKKKDLKWAWKHFGYNGPEKEFSGVKLIHQ